LRSTKTVRARRYSATIGVVWWRMCGDEDEGLAGEKGVKIVGTLFGP